MFRNDRARSIWESPLESAVRALGASQDAYAVEYSMVAMRDGVRLATVAIRPTGPGPHSAVLIRTPTPTSTLPDFFRGVFSAGYGVVVQFERGSEMSVLKLVECPEVLHLGAMPTSYGRQPTYLAIVEPSGFLRKGRRRSLPVRVAGSLWMRRRPTLGTSSQG